MKNGMVLVVVWLLIMANMGGCGLFRSQPKGPADGHSLDWYVKHPEESRAENHFCNKTFMDPAFKPDVTQDQAKEMIAKIPNYCRYAISAIEAQEAADSIKALQQQMDTPSNYNPQQIEQNAWKGSH